MSTPVSNSEILRLHKLYDHLADNFEQMGAAFLGNASLNEHFKEIKKKNPNHKTPTIEYQSITGSDTFTTNIFGEIASSDQGTRLKANGNVRLDSSQPIRDHSKCKMVVTLRKPGHITAKLDVCFDNQAAAWHEIYNSHLKDDEHNNIMPTSTKECVNEPSTPREGDLPAVSYIVHFPKTFTSGKSVRTSSATTMRPTIRRSVADAPNQTKADVAKSTTPGATANSLPVTKDASYPFDMLPDCLSSYFKLEHDQLQQQDISDINGQLIPPWKYADLLRPGTLMMFNVSLECFNIPSTTDSHSFRRHYQMNVIRGQVLNESNESMEYSSIPTTTTHDSTSSSPGPSSLSAFSQLAQSRKREDTDEIDNNNGTSPPKRTKRDKGHYKAMDTSS